jgi:hypothetical protein
MPVDRFCRKEHAMNQWPAKHTRRALLLAAAISAIAPTEENARAAAWHAVTVWKDPDCGCCTGWVEHLRKNGFLVTVIETPDVQSVKVQRRVPPELASCHTAEIAGYTIEGHVPARAILRLLAEKPNARGLSVPGMPIGSPGMEGGKPEPYDVILFGEQAPRRFERFLGDQSF